MRIAVLGGGRSSEHEVSLRSAAAVAAGLEAAGHEPVAVTIDRDGRWSCDGAPVTLEPGGGLLGCDVAFPALHGPYGEDGVVQGLLETLDVPYCGAGVAASALCMDKVRFKDVLSVADIPQVEYVSVRAPAFSQPTGHGTTGGPGGVSPPFGFPCFVKPARLGSSVGISKVVSADELPAALAAAWEHDPLAIVEAASDGLEIECSVIGDDEPEPSIPGEIEIDADWYDYEAKYDAGGMRLVVPARIPEPVAERVRALAADVYRRVGCAGMARCDFFVEDPDGDARVLVNELNTIPGFTETSVFAKLFEASGVAYPDLLDRLLTLALDRHARERSYSF
ncbi:MAG: D-alanine--D-alanine ligase family protein [Thermoleophilaceae bacterium]